MSKITPVKNNKESFTVKDTDFLLKLIMRSSFDGADIDIAYNVLKKLTELHRSKLESWFINRWFKHS